MAELANCESCGKLFVQATTPICPSCRQEIEKKFETVWKYMRKKENREATVNEIYLATGVEEKLIFKWIQEGRLQIKDFKNLHYPCEICGSPIQTGMLCGSCYGNMSKQLAQSAIDDTKTDEKQKTRTYVTR